jgi:hypothetical protein
MLVEEATASAQREKETEHRVMENFFETLHDERLRAKKKDKNGGWQWVFLSFLPTSLRTRG